MRCDIPAPKSPSANPYAFVEFEDPRDAELAHRDLHGLPFGNYSLSIQYAKNAPSSAWRFDGPPPPRRRRDDRGPPRRRSPSPRARDGRDAYDDRRYDDRRFDDREAYPVRSEERDERWRDEPREEPPEEPPEEPRDAPRDASRDEEPREEPRHELHDESRDAHDGDDRCEERADDA